MKKLISIGLIALFGCNSPKHIAKMQRLYCPTVSDSVTSKTIIKVERHDSTIYITTPAESIYIASPCDSLLKGKTFDIKQTQNGIKEEIKGDSKGFTFNCATDSLIDVIHGLNVKVTENNSRVETKVIQEACTRKHHTGWDTFCNWVTIIVLSLSLLFLVWQIAKIYFKVPKI